MLLVMDTAGVFKGGETDTGAHNQLWALTWERIASFLPQLKDELSRSQVPRPVFVQIAGPTGETIAANRDDVTDP